MMDVNRKQIEEWRESIEQITHDVYPTPYWVDVAKALLDHIDSRQSVTQDWLLQIPIRMQSTLLLGLRGTDTHSCPNVKKIQRWLRGLAFVPGNPANVAEFMGSEPERIIEKSACAKELEFCTQHFYSHLMHAIEVIAYRHPEPKVQDLAYGLFMDMCSLFHLPVEDHDTFEARLGTAAWPGGVQPQNFEEAMDMIKVAPTWKEVLTNTPTTMRDLKDIPLFHDKTDEYDMRNK